MNNPVFMMLQLCLIHAPDCNDFCNRVHDRRFFVHFDKPQGRNMHHVNIIYMLRAGMNPEVR